MAIRKKTSTTRLPQSLQQQLDEAASTSTSANSQSYYSRNRNGRKSHLAAPSRKNARKQDRLARKQNKAVYFASSHMSNARKRGAEEELVESPQRKKLKSHGSNIAVVPKVTKSLRPQSVVQDIVPVVAPKRTDAPPSIKMSKQSTTATKSAALEKAKKKSLTVELKPPPKEDEEDAYIAYLESKLGIDKGGKKKGKMVDEDDGLDDLMAWVDSLVVPITKSEEKDGNEDADSSSSESESFGDYDEEEEWHGIGESVEHSNSESNDETDTPRLPQLATSGAYAPPHLRNAQRRDDSSSEAILKLTRQLKGLLNRIGEQNIGTILDSVEEVYRNHRRNDVTSTLTTLIIDGISSHSSLLDSYVVLYAAFVSSLHKIVGVEFAAHLVQTLVASYERHYASMEGITMSSTDATEQDGKECSNLLVLISELYNFQVVSSVLVFDVIRHLLSDNLTEFKVELLLKILRNSGQQLRQDDPSALKDIIEIVQGKVSIKDDRVNSRTRFMIETLASLKNNKSKRNVAQNQGGAAMERMKKFLSGLSKTRHVLAHEPLRLSLEDFHSAESKGKWWLVGAAWGGDPLVDKQAEFTKTTGVSASDQEVTIDEDAYDLGKLARSQGMNTDIRRGIFVVLMSSDDYIDACERLSQLNLTEVQQREIIRVLLHCCGNESSYNPYYSLVGQELSRTVHPYKITLQFTLWDFLRDLGESNVGGATVIQNVKEDVEFDVRSMSKTRIQHVAKAYAWWIAKDCASLMILKPVDFTRLKSQTCEFFKELLIQIFISSQRSTPLANSNIIKDLVFTRNRNAIEEIFMKVSRVEALAMGLVFFLSESFPEKYFKSDDGFSKFLKWAVGVAKDTLRTGIDLIPTTV